MSWLIVDSNQVGAFVKNISRLPSGTEGLTLNPLVFGELILTNKLDWIRHLMQFPIRFGVDTAGIWDLVAKCPLERIPVLDTYLSRSESMSLRERVRAMAAIPAELMTEAVRIKKRNTDFQTWMVKQSQSARESITRANGGKIPRWDDPSSELRKMIEDRSVAAGLYDYLSDDGNRIVSMDPRLIEMVLENMRLRRWLAMMTFYQFSITGLWWDQRLNSKSPQKDDWTDLTSVLYARNGDRILTADKWLRRAVDAVEGAVDSTVRLGCVTVDEL